MAIVSSYSSLLYHFFASVKFFSHMYGCHHLNCLYESPRLPAKQQICHPCGEEGNVRPRVFNLDF